MDAGKVLGAGAEPVSDKCHSLNHGQPLKGLAADFERAFNLCEDATYIRPVSLIVSNVLERQSAGISKDLAWNEVSGLIAFVEASNPDKYKDVIKAARIGLGLQKDDTRIPPELSELKSSVPKMLL